MKEASKGPNSPFQMGDRVEVIGPSDNADNYIGSQFEITQLYLEKDPSRCWYSHERFPTYHASSLRLVESELKVGDYVAIANPTDMQCNRVYKIHCIVNNCLDKYPIQLDDKSWWRPTSLRKLSPEEVEKHQPISCHIDCDILHELIKKIKQFDGEIDYLRGQISECLIESGDVEARAKFREMEMEKRLGSGQNKIAEARRQEG